MDKATRRYLDDQLLQFAPVRLENCGQIKLKLHSKNGETNWLNITAEQARAIEFILVPEEVE